MRKEDFSNLVINKFSKLVFDTECCIEWPFNKTEKGYGRFTIFLNGKNKSLKAHRASYIIYNGEVKDSINVCHSCDNPGCINPKHLFLCTQRDNMIDCNIKGRKYLDTSAARKTLILNSKVSFEDIEFMRKQYSLGQTQVSLALKFNVSKSFVNLVILNKTRVNE